MKWLKKILFLHILICLLILSSCSKKANDKSAEIPQNATTPDLVFCANAFYESKDDIPDVILSYCCKDKEYTGDVKLYFYVGQTCAIFTNDNDGRSFTLETFDNNILHVINEYYLDPNYKLQLYETDEYANKVSFLKDFPSLSYTYTSNFWLTKGGKYLLNGWSKAYGYQTIISKESFSKEKGEIYISLYQIVVNTSEETVLKTIKIEYENDGQSIKLIPPAGSFSGQDGKTDQERFAIV